MKIKGDEEGLLGPICGLLRTPHKNKDQLVKKVGTSCPGDEMSAVCYW